MQSKAAVHESRVGGNGTPSCSPSSGGSRLEVRRRQTPLRCPARIKYVARPLLKASFRIPSWSALLPAKRRVLARQITAASFKQGFQKCSFHREQSLAGRCKSVTLLGSCNVPPSSGEERPPSDDVTATHPGLKSPRTRETYSPRNTKQFHERYLSHGTSDAQSRLASQLSLFRYRRARRCSLLIGWCLLRRLQRFLAVWQATEGQDMSASTAIWQLAKRLARNDQGINSLDNTCKEHDIAYNLTNDTILADIASKIRKNPSTAAGEKLGAWVVDKVMRAKVKRGMGVRHKTKRKTKKGGIIPFLFLPLTVLSSLLEGVSAISRAKLDIPYFRGVYMRDDLPKKPNLHEGMIVNLDSKQNEGTYWVALIKNINHSLYYNSFGDLCPPIEILSAIVNISLYINNVDINGNSSQLCAVYFPSLELDGEWQTSLIEFITYNSIPNIDMHNQSFTINIGGKTYKIVIMVESYELDDIETFIKAALLKDVHFQLRGNPNTSTSAIYSNVDIDFTEDNSITNVLGYERRVYPANEWHESSKQVGKLSVNVCRINGNIVGSSYLNGKPTNTLHEFMCAVDPGYKII
ncbi:hypothetical protein PR048_030493 [Dryococelus australis]|uniref:Uncharacterized protein n=1 Tax=Dryococelus australis TaxID=614101 RepID=A0ABQ9G9X9_9NEOP|nr:hypothetical protein PR048_030493 [Dryococelus australis]